MAAIISATAWQGRLNEAPGKEDVVAVCRQFLSHWTHGEIEELPAGCRPNATIDSDYVNAYALMLIRQLGIGDRVTAPMLYKMSTFFTRAALRLAEITDQGREIPLEQKRSRSGTS